MSPLYIREEDIPAEVLEHERHIATARALDEGKPEAVVPKIVDGMLAKFKDEVVLLRQKYIRDEAITVEQLVNQAVASLHENIVIRRFVRWQLGEESSSEL
jgi:elongation factor Ts